MKKTVIQSTPLGKQSMLDKLYKNDPQCISIAKKVNPNVGEDFVGYVRQGKANFKGCIKTEVHRGTKAHFQKFDFVFNVTCTYMQKEMIEGNQDNFTTYSFHEIKVVVRENIDKPIEVIVDAMQNAFKGNVLLLKFYSGNIDGLQRQLSAKQIHLMFEDEL
jgi:hypothetical protein